MNLTTTRHRRAGAALATGALFASALLFTSSSAQAAIADVRESQIAPTESPLTYAGWHQGAENPTGSGNWGKFKVINEGLELDGRSQVINGFSDNSNTDLANASRRNVSDIASLSSSAFTGPNSVTFQVPLFFDTGSGAQFATLRSSNPAAGPWQSSKAIGSIAANTNATLGQFKEAIGANYRVIAFGVYNETGASVVKDITFAGTTYTFKNNSPVTSSKSVTTKVNLPVVLPGGATDVDGNILTYTPTSVVGGTVSGPGTSLTFTPAKNFKGTASVGYTVTDDRGGSATGSVAIKVEKYSTDVDIYRVKPVSGTISVRNTVSFYATVKINGKPAPQGTTIQGYAKSKLVVTGKVNSSGKVLLRLPNPLPFGKSTLKAVKVGSPTLDRSEDSVAVRVTRR